MKTRFPGGRWIQGDIWWGGDTRFPRRDRAEAQNEFLGLFNNDRDLLQRYAALSNFAALMPSRSFVEVLAHEVGLELDKTLLDLRAFSERTGMKLFEAIGDMIFTYA